MSNDDRPEFQVLRELEETVAQVSVELAGWRRRAHKAETERAEIAGDADIVAARARVVELERENQDLRRRIQMAKDRVSDLLSRLRFLEEQAATEHVRQ